MFLKRELLMDDLAHFGFHLCPRHVVQSGKIDEVNQLVMQRHLEFGVPVLLQMRGLRLGRPDLIAGIATFALSNLPHQPFSA